MAAPKPETGSEVIAQIRKDIALLQRRGAGRQMAVGAVVIWPTANTPPRTLLCDGTVYSMVDYPELGAELGSLYGGNGTTTFAVPNYKGVTIVGQDSAQTEFDTIGEAGGSKTVTLTVAQLAEHAHGQTVSAAGSGPGVRIDYSSDGESVAFEQGIDTETAGSSQAHPNLQPYRVARFIIQA